MRSFRTNAVITLIGAIIAYNSLLELELLLLQLNLLFRAWIKQYSMTEQVFKHKQTNLISAKSKNLSFNCSNNLYDQMKQELR